MQYTADFETTTELNDCRVWLWDICTIDDKLKHTHGKDIKTFIDYIQSRGKTDVYFHNLKFDGQFILDYLLKNGFTYSDIPKDNTFSTLISKENVFYSIKITFKKSKNNPVVCCIYDSLKKLPMPVRKIAETFDLPIRKGEIDYRKYRPLGYEADLDEIAYIRNDTEIMARALKHQFDTGLLKMTVGSDALTNYKKSIGKTFLNYFPILSYSIDSFIRKSYKGGFVYVNDIYANREIGNGIVFDVNSLYPSVMYHKKLPYGVPVYYTGEYEKDNTYDLYIAHIIVSFKIKNAHIPCIQIKRNPLYVGTEYIKETYEPVELYITSVELELLKKQYDIEDIIYIDGYKFKSKKGMFKDYIDYWSNIKATTTGGMRQLAKLMLNSLYGKFATNPDTTSMIPYLDSENGIVKYKLGESSTRDPVYTAVGSFITAYGRAQTVTTAQNVYDRFLYADTDSIHLIGTNVPDNINVHDTKLGYWKHESTFTRGKFIRAKTYIEEIDGKLNVKCAGMTDIIKQEITFDNFSIGFESTKKLKPKKVNGGVVLVDSPFTIKG